MLELLAKEQLFAKKSKCVFACGEVEYLGHLISGEGVRIDLRKQWQCSSDLLQRMSRL